VNLPDAGRHGIEARRARIALCRTDNASQGVARLHRTSLEHSDVIEHRIGDEADDTTAATLLDELQSTQRDASRIGPATRVGVQEIHLGHQADRAR